MYLPALQAVVPETMRCMGVLAHQETDGSFTALRANVHTSTTDTKRIVGTIIDYSPASLTIRTRTSDVFAVKLAGSTRYWVDGLPVSPKLDGHYSEEVIAVA